MAVKFLNDYAGTRRIGAARPTALMFTSGVGAIAELPNLTVIIRGLDAWDITDADVVNEPRLLSAVQARLGMQVEKMVAPPHAPENSDDPTGTWSRIGVPVTPFPRWLRCTRCDYLGPMDSDQFALQTFSVNVDKSRFVHTNCQQAPKGGLAVAARFVLACEHGHLDDFPYAYFVHHGQPCARPRYEMQDFGRGLGPQVSVKCTSCGATQTMITAFGPKAAGLLPSCRGRNPQLGSVENQPCRQTPRAMVLGASNLWFPQVLTSLYLPHAGGDLHTLIQANWAKFQAMGDNLDAILGYALAQDADLAPLRGFPVADVKQAVIELRAPASGAPDSDIDLKTPEWEAFTNPGGNLAPGDADFRLKPVPLPSIAPEIGLSNVVLVERLRLAKAFVGFTRISSYDPEDTHSNVKSGRLAHSSPTWVPAVDARGEGIFLRFDENFISQWEAQARDNGTLKPLFDAHRERNRRIGKTGPAEYSGWIGERAVLLHTLAHGLIRQMSLDCGYSAQSLSERIYTGTPTSPHAGILIYTTAADSEGTLGGLVYLGQPLTLDRLIRAALSDAVRCSGDPLCGEHQPTADLMQLHGAACHLCTFAAETTCEYNNRYLDRAVLVDVGPRPTPITARP